ncbi:MAG: NifB/NifX family molybdenum-iron cluster-binding protein [Clostridia bacterium]
MKIAVTYENGQIFQHFGHTEQFKIYEVNSNRVVSSNIVSTNGSGHGALSQFLKDNEVDVLICGGIGGGAQAALADVGIRLFGGVSGSSDDAVNALIENTLSFNPDVKCNHHDHEHGDASHTCGDHGCGKNNCGNH